jgi:hypothetical protein
VKRAETPRQQDILVKKKLRSEKGILKRFTLRATRVRAVEAVEDKEDSP